MSKLVEKKCENCGLTFKCKAPGTYRLFCTWCKRTDRKEPIVEIGKCESSTAWATYYYPGRIRIQAPSEPGELLETAYCKTIIGMDHEYLHHVLFNFVNKQASEQFDNLAGALIEHSLWTGLNLIIVATTEAFWSLVEA